MNYIWINTPKPEMCLDCFKYGNAEVLKAIVFTPCSVRCGFPIQNSIQFDRQSQKNSRVVPK
jgi:hypothetical protein